MTLTLSDRFARLLLLVCATIFLSGCGGGKTDAELDTDANGYACAKCGEKFYTDRDVFANACPKCKQGDIHRVVGYYCETDKHATLSGRSRGAMRCEKCGQATTGQLVPKESDYKAWGASKRTAAEVGA